MLKFISESSDFYIDYSKISVPGNPHVYLHCSLQTVEGWWFYAAGHLKEIAHDGNASCELRRAM